MRTARAILALYILVWFNAVVPGHTRGVITLPAAGDRAVQQADSCCHPPAGGKSDQPSPDQKRRCAVCFVAATYAATAVFVVDLRPAGDVVAAVLLAPVQFVHINYPPAFYPTGPPTRCA